MWMVEDDYKFVGRCEQLIDKIVGDDSRSDKIYVDGVVWEL